MTEAEENPSNEPQIRFWNTGPGAKWVDHQQGLDHCFENFNRRVVTLCDPRPGDRVMDIGCGAGATCIAVSAASGNEAEITGFDVSRPLLEHARQRVKTLGLKNVDFVEGDAQVYSFQRGHYDHMVSRFGCMFFIDPSTAFRNMATAIRPGGKMTFIAWAGMESNPWFRVPRDRVVEILGEPAPKDPRAPGPLAFADIDYVSAILDDAGLAQRDLRYEDNTIETGFALEEMTSLACNLGPAVRQMNDMNATAEQRQRVHDAVMEDFEKYTSESGITIPAKLVVCEIRN